MYYVSLYGRRKSKSRFRYQLLWRKFYHGSRTLDTTIRNIHLPESLVTVIGTTEDENLWDASRFSLSARLTRVKWLFSRKSANPWKIQRSTTLREKKCGFHSDLYHLLVKISTKWLSGVSEGYSHTSEVSGMFPHFRGFRKSSCASEVSESSHASGTLETLHSFRGRLFSHRILLEFTSMPSPIT